MHAKEFSEVWTYFLDHFGEDPDFMSLGEPARHSFLEMILGQVGRQLHGKPVPLVDLLLKRLPEQGFLHGACTLGGQLASLLYFEDIHMGLMAVVWSISPPETKFARFTARPMPDAWKRSDN
jgi:hypothetical protein